MKDDVGNLCSDYCVQENDNIDDDDDDNDDVGIQSKNPVSETTCIQTKLYRLYRKMTINGHFSV